MQSISNEVTFALPPASFLKAKNSGSDETSLDLLKNSESNGSDEAKSNSKKSGSGNSDPNASALGDLGILHSHYFIILFAYLCSYSCF